MLKGCLIYFIFPVILILYNANNEFCSITCSIILFICGLLWSIFDLVRKLAIELYSLKHILYITTQLIIFTISLLLSDTSISSYNYYPLLFIIAILNILSLYLFLKALEIEEISICICYYSPLFSLLFSKLILKEGLSTEQHIGILVIFSDLLFYTVKVYY